MFRLIALFLFLLSGCATVPDKAVAPLSAPTASGSACAPCLCQSCPAVEPPKLAAKPYETATWLDLPGWAEEDPTTTFATFIASCVTLGKQPVWRDTCASGRSLQDQHLDGASLRDWLENHLAPWQLVNADGSRTGTITGYYEPILKGSRQRQAPYLQPLYGVPDDLLVINLAEIYPELKGMRLRGRLDGRKVVPYASRAEIARDEATRSTQALLWIDDAVELFFMQIQGSGQVDLDDGSRIRVAYADQNGHPYHAIGKWLVDHGEMKLEQTSMQNIKAWAIANPARLQELLNANPSMVFFRELPVEGSGPPGALGLALTPERSLAVDARTTPLGTPVWLASTYPSSERALTRLMLAQDTGGAIRGPVRADFFWGSGPLAGEQAGKMRQRGQMWLLLPIGHTPDRTPSFTPGQTAAPSAAQTPKLR
jgi:membrane-bound lytic murein transglycosylase A